ncbi:hypothetical protein LOK49_LG06G01884 [Camellia lanceoleosa]|uniref:Uncharacterized protein n=1 Tax=Camellia lanceoleosa TaxID=1840588 RepID=A0ACC0HBW4_9ERIC|nr:hypothetical protein LOK49_LG06G01884 [Camellia lanceoleosa]
MIFKFNFGILIWSNGGLVDGGGKDPEAMYGCVAISLGSWGGFAIKGVEEDDCGGRWWWDCWWLCDDDDGDGAAGGKSPGFGFLEKMKCTLVTWLLSENAKEIICLNYE